MVAKYSSGQDNQYFGWTDATQDNAFSLADKFVSRFRTLAKRGEGWDDPYAGWYQRFGRSGLAPDSAVRLRLAVV